MLLQKKTLSEWKLCRCLGCSRARNFLKLWLYPCNFYWFLKNAGTTANGTNDRDIAENFFLMQWFELGEFRSICKRDYFQNPLLSADMDCVVCYVLLRFRHSVPIIGLSTEVNSANEWLVGLHWSTSNFGGRGPLEQQEVWDLVQTLISWDTPTVKGHIHVLVCW